MIDWLPFVGVWLIGVSFSMAALSAMGEDSPVTYGDSFSGDDFLDLLLIALWPIFWPCWGAYRLDLWVFARPAKGQADE